MRDRPPVLGVACFQNNPSAPWYMLYIWVRLSKGVIEEIQWSWGVSEKCSVRNHQSVDFNTEIHGPVDLGSIFAVLLLPKGKGMRQVVLGWSLNRNIGKKEVYLNISEHIPVIKWFGFPTTNWVVCSGINSVPSLACNACSFRGYAAPLSMKEPIEEGQPYHVSTYCKGSIAAHGFADCIGLF